MRLFRTFSSISNSSYRLLIKGLPFEVTESDISLFFRGFTLSKIEFLTRREKFLGAAYVYLDSEAQAREAKSKVDGTYLKNRKVRVALDFLDIGGRVQGVQKVTSVDRFREPSRDVWDFGINLSSEAKLFDLLNQFPQTGHGFSTPGYLMEVIDGNLGKYCEVVSFRQMKQGRGSSSIQVEYLDLTSKKVFTQNYPVGSKVDKVDLEKRNGLVQYVDEDSKELIVSDHNFEDKSLPLTLVGAGYQHLTGGDEITLYYHGDVVVKVGLPNHILTKLK